MLVVGRLLSDIGKLVDKISDDFRFVIDFILDYEELFSEDHRFEQVKQIAFDYFEL